MKNPGENGLSFMNRKIAERKIVIKIHFITIFFSLLFFNLFQQALHGCFQLQVASPDG